MPAGRPGRPPSDLNAVTIAFTVPARVHERLVKMAKERSLTPSAYAAALFNAAYSARVSAEGSGDRELDSIVAATMILLAHEYSAATIARTLNISPDLAERIESAWETSRKELA